MKRKLIYLTLLCVTLFCLCSCHGKNDELAQYKENCNTFYEKISKADLAITRISKDDPDYSKQLLKELDELALAFEEFKSAEVPEDFAAAGMYAQSASDNMSKAAKLYHEAFESDPFDSSLAQNAGEYYDTALEYVNCVGEILQGNDPSKEEVLEITD